MPPSTEPAVTTSARQPPLAQPWVVAALGGSVLFLVAVLVILVAVTPDVTRWMSWSTTTGVVGSLNSAPDRTDVVYAFEVDDQVYEGEHEVPGGTDVKVAGPVGVRYDASDPHDSVPEAVFEDQVAFLIGSVLVAAAVSVAVGLLLLRWRRRVDAAAEPRGTGSRDSTGSRGAP